MEDFRQTCARIITSWNKKQGEGNGGGGVRGRHHRSSSRSMHHHSAFFACDVRCPCTSPTALKTHLFQNCFLPVSLFHSYFCPCSPWVMCVCVCACLCVGVCVSVSIVIVKHPVLPLCVEEWALNKFPLSLLWWWWLLLLLYTLLLQIMFSWWW